MTYILLFGQGFCGCSVYSMEISSEENDVILPFRISSIYTIGIFSVRGVEGSAGAQFTVDSEGLVQTPTTRPSLGEQVLPETSGGFPENHEKRGRSAGLLPEATWLTVTSQTSGDWSCWRTLLPQISNYIQIIMMKTKELSPQRPKNLVWRN